MHAQAELQVQARVVLVSVKHLIVFHTLQSTTQHMHRKAQHQHPAPYIRTSFTLAKCPSLQQAEKFTTAGAALEHTSWKHGASHTGNYL